MHSVASLQDDVFGFQCTTNVSRTYIQASELGLALMLMYSRRRYLQLDVNYLIGEKDSGGIKTGYLTAG